MPVGSTPFPGVGVLYRATDQMRFLELARAADERGFTSLVLGEHTHIPVTSDPRRFPGDGESIPDSYPRLLDPYVALSFVAAQTSLKIATCTSLPAQHDPIALAKALATLDFLSEGRLTLGVGYGWNPDELVNHGHDYEHRRAIVREHVELMRTLWTDNEAEYHGVHANLERSWSWPKPAQTSIPVLLGAAGRARRNERAARRRGLTRPGRRDLVPAFAVTCSPTCAARSRLGSLVAVEPRIRTPLHYE